jgi:ketosteroid isomerase-like protein
MASANLDLVRSIYATWERGDYSAGEWQDPKIEFVIADGPTPGSWTGAAGIAEGWGDFLRAWEEFHHEMDDCRELDDERVLVLSHFGGRGKTSGLEVGRVTTKAATLFHIRRGKVTGIVQYFDRDHALANLGLDPETGSRRA